MKRPSVVLALIVPVVALVLAASVVYVSLIGENNKIDELTRTFFQEIGESAYGQDTGNVRVKAPGPTEDTSDSLFLLKLSLLKHYNLLNDGAYEVSTRRDRLWTPFDNDGLVEVSVSLRRKPREGDSLGQVLSRLGSSWSSDQAPGSISHLVTVRRKNGNWVIDSVNISGSVIEETYNDMRERLGSHRRVTMSPHSIIVHEFTVAPDRLDPVERLILLHTLHKIQMRLEGRRSAPANRPSFGLRPG